MSNYLVTGNDLLGAGKAGEAMTEHGATDLAQLWAEDGYTDVVIWKRHATVRKVVAFNIELVEED